MKGFNTILLSFLVAVVTFFVYSHHQEQLKREAQAQKEREISHAYQQARRVHTLEAYNNFLVSFSHTKHTDQALHYRDELLLEQAKATKDIETVEYFIQTYPKSSHQSAARWWRDQLIIDKIDDEPTIEAYETFLQKHPESSWVKNVIHKRDRLIYKQLKKINTEEAYTAFLKDHPQSPYREKVELKLEALKKVYARRKSETDFKNEILSSFRRKQEVSPLVKNNSEEKSAKFRNYKTGPFDFSILPKDIATVFLSASNGKQSPISIDLPGRPILLILSSYAAVEWELDISEETQVVGVLVGSYNPNSKLYANQHLEAYLLPPKTLQHTSVYEDYFFRKTLLWLNKKAPHIKQFDYFYSEYNIRSPHTVNTLPRLAQWHLDWPKVEKPTKNFDFSLYTEASYVGQLTPASTPQEQSTETSNEQQRLPKFLREPQKIPRKLEPTVNIEKPYSLLGPKFDNASIYAITPPHHKVIVRENNSYYTFDSNGIKRYNLTTHNLLKHYPLPSNFKKFHSPEGIAYDSYNKYVTVVTSGGEGAFYRFDTLKKQWKDYRSFNNILSPNSLAYSPKGNYYAVSDRHKDTITILSDDGIPIESHNLKGKLPGYKQTYNGLRPPLSIIPNGDVLAIINIPGRLVSNPDYTGMVTQIWEYKRDTQKARLTYYVDVAAPL